MTDLIGEIQDELGSGLFPSQPGRKPVFWKDGRNVAFEYGLIQSALGQFALFSSSQAAVVTGVRATEIAGIPTVFFGTTTKLWKWDETNGIEELTNSGGDYTGTTTDTWSFARWGSWVTASNGVDPVQVYKNTADFIDLVGPSFTWAKIIYTTDTHMFAINTSNGENFVEWCALDDIEDWTATSINQAGNKPLRNLDSELICGQKLGESLIVYTTNEMQTVDFIGSPFVHAVNPLLDGFGPVSKNAVATVAKQHFGFGRRGIWVTDGVSFQFVQSPALFDFVYVDEATRVDTDLLDLVVGWHDQLQHQAVFYYPSLAGDGTNDVGVAINYDTGAWTVYDYGRSAVDDSGVFPFAITGDKLGNIYQQSTTGTSAVTGTNGVIDLEPVYKMEMGLGIGGIGEGGIGGYSDGTG